MNSFKVIAGTYSNIIFFKMNSNVTEVEFLVDRVIEFVTNVQDIYLNIRPLCRKSQVLFHQINKVKKHTNKMKVKKNINKTRRNKMCTFDAIRMLDKFQNFYFTTL
jgi:hypothetical protein